MTPARGAGDLACPAISRLKGRAAPAATILSPVARDYPSGRLQDDLTQFEDFVIRDLVLARLV